MASKGQVDLLLNSLPTEEKKVLSEVFRYVLSWFALGTTPKAENFAWYRVTGTTHVDTNTEFSIAHGMDHAPQNLIPIVDLTAVNSQLVPLTVTRAPDARRIYLKSVSTNVTFCCYLE